MVSTSGKLRLLAGLAAILLPAGAAAQAPLGAGEQVAWSHAPYEAGECALCHESDDREAPGPISAASVNELCFQCHDEMEAAMTERPSVHFAAQDACTNCHNPHNAGYRKLLLQSMPGLCLDCHDDIGEVATSAKVRHDALTNGNSCVNCHNPHASNVEKLLHQLPYNLCIDCHGVDGVADDTGKELANIKALIESQPELHGPVAAEDCSACHQPHGGDHFRLLVLDYPAKFYSPFEPENYALCFTCHDSRVVAEAETTTLTNFRDGSRNLHYLHVNKAERGRTCRACHEVHAAEHVHIIRDRTPYGKSGWQLPVNYEPSPNGGRCTKTCHSIGEYDRTRE